jgi:hypothetical protein
MVGKYWGHECAPTMKRKVVLIVLVIIGVSISLYVLGFLLKLSGDIPGFMEPDEVEYLKTLNIQPSFGRIWFASTMSRDPTYSKRPLGSVLTFDTDETAVRRGRGVRDHPRGL